MLFILLCFYFLFRRNWSLSTEETSAYRPVSWDAKWNNRNETTSNQDSKAYHNSMVARFIKWLNSNIECCCKNKLFKSKRDFVPMINIHWIQCVKIKSVDDVMDKHFFVSSNFSDNQSLCKIFKQSYWLPKIRWVNQWINYRINKWILEQSSVYKTTLLWSKKEKKKTIIEMAREDRAN